MYYSYTALHVFYPPCSTLQPVSCHDVIGQIPVDYSNDLRGRHILSEQFGMTLGIPSVKLSHDRVHAAFK
jgi:hypothetical protein